MTRGVARTEGLPALSDAMRATEIQPGRETDARVATVVLGMSRQLGRGTWAIPMVDGCVYVEGLPNVSEHDGTAWRYLWPKIVEKLRATFTGEVGVTESIIEGGYRVRRYEYAEAVQTIAEAPTLALCLTRAALALYGDEP